MLTETDRTHLARCVELAAHALEQGNEPFGSRLVDAAGRVLAEEENRVGGGDHTEHPEFRLAKWAAAHLTPEARATATVYTSGEHCPMCAAAHAWVGLGRIVYASSSAELSAWRRELGLPEGRVRALPIADVIRATPVDGPDPALSAQVKALQIKAAARRT